MKSTWFMLVALSLFVVGLAGCQSDADVASHNLSKAADNFQVNRRIILYNTWTDKYVMTIEGYCSLGNTDGSGQRSVTCKTPNGYKKHFLGLTGNVSFFVEQIDNAHVSTGHYRVIFKPSTIIPEIDLR